MPCTFRGTFIVLHEKSLLLSGHYLSFHNKGKGSFGDVIALAKTKLGLWQSREALTITTIEKLLSGQPKGVKFLTSLFMRDFKDVQTAEKDKHAINNSRMRVCLSLA